MAASGEVWSRMEKGCSVTSWDRFLCVTSKIVGKIFVESEAQFGFLLSFSPPCSLPAPFISFPCPNTGGILHGVFSLTPLHSCLPSLSVLVSGAAIGNGCLHLH